MCIVALAWQTSPQNPLVLIANRDEFYDREAAPLSRWHNSRIIAGRDLQSGGSWLGITDTGRWAVITNYREQKSPDPLLSRGSLVADYLNGEQPPLAFLQSINQAAFAGFNLIVGTLHDAATLGNRGTPPQVLPAGVYGLSNALLNTGWPKTRRLLQGFASLDLKSDDAIIDTAIVDAGLALLDDETRAPDAELPQTGVGLAREQMLSSIRIVSPNYGTRVSSVLLLSQQGYLFAEKTLKPIARGCVQLTGAWRA